MAHVDTEISDTLKELKEVIFDLDWEISDSSLEKLTSVISPLKEKWSDRKPYLVCLKIIDNVGHYIKKAKHKAHPEAVKLLSSVFRTLEKIDSDDSLTENDRVKMVRVELEKYNGLKGEITGEKKEGTEKPAGGETAGGGPVPPSAAEEPKVDEGEEREVVLTRPEEQSFPEAEQLLDDFFADEARISEARRGGEAGPAPDAAEAVEEGETVEFQLGGSADSDKKIANIFGATEAELEAQVGEKLGLPEEELLEERQEAGEAESAGSLQGESEKKLEAIINQFSREISSMISEELKKAVREEMARTQQGE